MPIQEKPEITLSFLEHLREILRDATAQVVDTHDEIDLNWRRAGKTIQGKEKALLSIVDGLDDDIVCIRRAQAFVREALSSEKPKI